VPEEIVAFCADKKAVLVIEEGNPDFIEQAIGQILRKADLQTKLHGKGLLPTAGEYTPLVLGKGLAVFCTSYGHATPALSAWIAQVDAQKAEVEKALGAALPQRPPTFCTGCPERPVFSAMKLLRQEMGPVHVSADIGCHSFATFAPFSQGNSILGYGMSLASAAAVSGTQTNRPISVMGDGGFWHNGLITGVAGAVFNKDDSVLVIMNNGYSSATGQQDILSSKVEEDGRGKGLDIEATLKSLGVPWIRRVRTYGVAGVMGTLREALKTGQKGLKVIIADGECQLARQRRIRPELARMVAAGKRVVRTRFWIDPEVCTGDHSCIRLSGCPSLTIKPNEDPLRTDPVAHVNNDCVGCGLCGEVAHAAQLCPSFAQIDIIQNPTAWDRLVRRLSAALIRLLGGGRRAQAAAPAPSLVPAE
jgi:indolepyruvate ferredoxin oxidoreductase, alpha subunit